MRSLEEHDMITVPVMRIPDSPVNTDLIACERALVIDIVYGKRFHRKVSRLSTTMRTPGHDQELAIGLLFTLGIIKHRADILELALCPRSKFEPAPNDVLTVHLDYDCNYQPCDHASGHVRYSSCGVCGSHELPDFEDARLLNGEEISVDVLQSLPTTMAIHQDIFSKTGGCHGVAIFDKMGKMGAIFEDVGRHNALDKLIGHFLMNDSFPHGGVLAMTSRASFEIVQKASRVNLKIVAVMGAVSSLAVELAHRHGITLVGFLRSDRLNVYTHPFRIVGL